MNESKPLIMGKQSDSAGGEIVLLGDVPRTAGDAAALNARRVAAIHDAAKTSGLAQWGMLAWLTWGSQKAMRAGLYTRPLVGSL